MCRGERMLRVTTRQSHCASARSTGSNVVNDMSPGRTMWTLKVCLVVRQYGMLEVGYVHLFPAWLLGVKIDKMDGIFNTIRSIVQWGSFVSQNSHSHILLPFLLFFFWFSRPYLLYRRAQALYDARGTHHGRSLTSLRRPWDSPVGTDHELALHEPC